MVKPLVDTNILIDYLRAIPQARDELQRYREKAISIITWMEVMVGVEPENERSTLGFLAGFELLTLDGQVAERAVSLRRLNRIKLPDAVVWATAQVHSLLLVTRNTKDFPVDDPAVRLPYVL